MHELLPAIRSIAGNVFVFQQDNASAQRALDSVELLCRETPQFISPPDISPANNLHLNPTHYRILGMLQERVYRVPIRDTYELRRGLNLSRTWWTMQLISGEKTGSM